MRLLAAAASLLAVALFAPAIDADTLFYVDRVTIHDANGRLVGTASPATPEIVEFRRGSIPVIVRVGPDGFFKSWVEFPNRGCAGQPLLGAFFRREFYRYTAVAGPRSTVYVQTGAARMWTTRSTLRADGTCIDRDPVRVFAVPVTATDLNLADEFVPPFTTRTRAGDAVPLTAP